MLQPHHNFKALFPFPSLAVNCHYESKDHCHVKPKAQLPSNGFRADSWISVFAPKISQMCLRLLVKCYAYVQAFLMGRWTPLIFMRVPMTLPWQKDLYCQVLRHPNMLSLSFFPMVSLPNTNLTRSFPSSLIIGTFVPNQEMHLKLSLCTFSTSNPSLAQYWESSYHANKPNVQLPAHLIYVRQQFHSTSLTIKNTLQCTGMIGLVYFMIRH